MDDDEPHETRRRILQLTGCGSVIAVSGCLGDGDQSDGDDERPDDWCLDELNEEPPEVERNALSIDGIERKDPENLQPKDQVGYQCGPLQGEGQQCGNCTFYIDDHNGNAVGACTEVAGQIRSVDWCAVWAPREELQED